MATDLERFGYSADNCSIRRTLDIVGEKWTLLVLREAFCGVRRFGDYHRALGCARDGARHPQPRDATSSAPV